MDNNKKVNFIRVNHKNRIDYFNEDKLVEFKMNLYTKLSNMQERDFSQNFNDYMENFIPDFASDPMELNYKMAKKFYDNNPNLKFERKCPEMLLVMDKLLNQNFNMEFKCNEVFVSFLSRALFFCFKDMKTNSKFYSGIKNFTDFKNKINERIYEDVNLKEYVVITKDEGKQVYKKSRNSGKVVQSFSALDNIEINLNNQSTKDDNKENKDDKNTPNKIINSNDDRKINKIIDFRNIEIASDLAKANLNETEKASISIENDCNNLINNKSFSELNIIQTAANINISSTSYFNNDSRKSSFKSNGDYNNSTTKKSTFSSTNGNNNQNTTGDVIIGTNSKFREGLDESEDKKEANFNNNLYIESQASSKEFKFEKGDLNDLSLEQQKTKIVNETNHIPTSSKNKEIQIEEKKALKKYSTESMIAPVKIKSYSCRILKCKNTEKEIEKVDNGNKKHTNTVLEKGEAAGQKQSKHNFFTRTEKKSSSKTNLNTNNSLKNSSSSKIFLNSIEPRGKSNTAPLGKIPLNFTNASEFFKFNFSHIINSKKHIYVECKNESEFDKYGIPIYLILLAQKLMTIKKITITIPKSLKNNSNGGNNNTNNNNNNNNHTNSNSVIDNYAIILLNLEWLFQNLLEIEIDFGVGSKKHFDKLFKVKYNKEANDIAYGKKFRNTLEDYKQSFELLILVCVLCSKLSNLYIFTLNNYSCYYFEMDYLTRTHHKELRIDGEDFSVDSLKRIFLKHYLYSSSQSTQAGCLIEKPDFSKLNSESGDGFEASTENLAFNNGNRKNSNNTYGAYLHSIYQSGFGFFKKNSNESVDIIKTDDYNSNNSSNYNYNLKSFVGNSNNSNYNNFKKSFLQTSSTRNSVINLNNNSEEFEEKLNHNFNFSPNNAATELNDIQSILSFLEEENENKFMGLIMKKFEPLLEELFFIIESKKNLMELNFNINLPNIISSNDNFIMTLQKFIFNVFKSLDNPDCNLKTIKIKSPYLCFNNRKYPVIEKFINTIDLQKNNCSINNFTLDIQINKIPNIVNLIPKNVQFLYLGEFDLETFIYFKKNFIEKKIFLESQINSLTISFNGSILDKALLINEFKYIYKSEKPVKLKEIQILSNLIVDKYSLKEILLSIKSDDIEKYYFEFNRQSLENFTYFRSNLQKINLRNDKDKVNETKLNYFFNVVKKYKQNIESNMSRKIVYNIIKFVTPIYVTNVEIKFRE